MSQDDVGRGFSDDLLEVCFVPKVWWVSKTPLEANTDGKLEMDSIIEQHKGAIQVHGSLALLPIEALDGRFYCDCKGFMHDGDDCAHIIAVKDRNDIMVPTIDSLLTKLPEMKTRGRKKRAQKVQGA